MMAARKNVAEDLLCFNCREGWHVCCSGIIHTAGPCECKCVNGKKSVERRRLQDIKNKEVQDAGGWNAYRGIKPVRVPRHVACFEEEHIENEEVITAASAGPFLKNAVMDLLNNPDRPVDNTVAMGEYMALKRARTQKGW